MKDEARLKESQANAASLSAEKEKAENLMKELNINKSTKEKLEKQIEEITKNHTAEVIHYQID